MPKPHSSRPPNSLAFNGKSIVTAYDAAVAVAGTQSEKDRLRDLRVRLNIPADSPDWQLYAMLVPGLGSAMGDEERATLFGQLDRVEKRVDRTATIDSLRQLLVHDIKPANKPISAAALRDVIVFAVSFVAFAAISVLSSGRPTSAVAYALAIVVGALGAAAFMWFAPIARHRN